MSKALDIADLIKARLLTAPAEGELATPANLTLLANVAALNGEDAILVDRQKDIGPMVTIRVAKASGTAVVILWDGHEVADANARRPLMQFAYSIRVYSKPVMSGEDFPADDVMESIINRLWQWVPLGGHQHREVRLTPGGMIPDRSFLIYDLGVLVPASL